MIARLMIHLLGCCMATEYTCSNDRQQEAHMMDDGAGAFGLDRTSIAQFDAGENGHRVSNSNRFRAGNNNHSLSLSLSRIL